MLPTFGSSSRRTPRPGVYRIPRDRIAEGSGRTEARDEGDRLRGEVERLHAERERMWVREVDEEEGAGERHV